MEFVSRTRHAAWPVPDQYTTECVYFWLLQSEQNAQSNAVHSKA